jgi:type I restriction enzyme M protein
VANPPFSYKSWSNGVNVADDEYNRFEYGAPPDKNGDYAFLLHILKSLKSTGKAAVILPHGVLFRGNAEATIRRALVRQGYIKGIIGLPANLFYGTGIPACILVLDKAGAPSAKAVYDRCQPGLVKDGNKNRLREQDIRKITDTFYAMSEIPKYSRMVPISEISDPKNDYNLNIPRYIDTQEPEDLQNIAAHLQGGIPEADIEALQRYWKLFPTLKKDLFLLLRPGFWQLAKPASELKNFIFGHPEFLAFNEGLQGQFDRWFAREKEEWEKSDIGTHPKSLIEQAGERLLQSFGGHALLDNYDLYQELLQYWNEAMQDDVYSISTEGWAAGKQWQRLLLKGKKGKDGKAGKDKEIAGLEGVEGRMIPPALLIDIYFKAEREKINAAELQIEQWQARLSEIEEEQSGEEGLFADLEKVNAGEITKLLKAKKQEKKSVPAMAAEAEAAYGDEIALLEEYQETVENIKKNNALIKSEYEKLEAKVLNMYDSLSTADIKRLVIDEKWYRRLRAGLEQEQERQSRMLTQRIKELAERYAVTLLELDADVENKKAKVLGHLRTMGFL